ncbi:hypothetical protein Pan189_27740 [Stratiformator vulcanicus]|uniref:Replication initiator protein A n=1 Tax=Stratiformator vulcanicus TaxID=2527980 RepID=A0A517R3C9_9PLAN|nr:hypothetical protein Pan189_27740 [Stratiformator vulcanicus]
MHAGSGLAPLTFVEHALCPLDMTAGMAEGLSHEVSFEYTDRNRNRKTAYATVAAPFGLSPHDELYLYGLLALTLAQPEPTEEFSATPHWCLRQLGIVDTGRQQQGTRYRQFRDAIRRLSGVIYQSNGFYDPHRGEHRDVAFGLLGYSLPADPASSRAWQFVWNRQFFQIAESIRGSFIFDLLTYRRLSPAARRLFLLLQKIFHRMDESPAFDLKHLAVNTLGFSDSLATKSLRQKLLRVATELLKEEIIALPEGAESVVELITKRSKGVYAVRFRRGAYFDREPRSAACVESPLRDPLGQIGLEAQTIDRVLRQFKPQLLQQWSDITLAAVEQKRIRTSPQAFFMHHVREAAEKRTTPPDWWRELRKKEFEQNPDERRTDRPTVQDDGFEQYIRKEGREAFQNVMTRIFEGLCESGQSEPEARRNAAYTARMNLRRQYRKDHPERAGDGPVSLGRMMEQRWGNQ